MITKEEKKIGRVSWRIYLLYFKSLGGYFIFSLLLLFFIVNEGISFFNNTWLSIWSSDGSKEFPKHSSQYYNLVYISITVCTIIVGSLSSFFMRYRGIVSATVLKVITSRNYMIL